MLNRKPIFINAFSRGGSNILWNVFLTHPDVCSPIVETLDIFRTGRYGRWSGYEAAWHTRQFHFFDQKNLAPRSPISKRAKSYIDQTLHDWKLKTLTDDEMRYKDEKHLYKPEEVRDARLVAKNNNGLTFLTDVFFDMYPDATFVALVRNPLAIYESYKRRGFTRSLEEFISFYTRIADRMLADAERYDRYHIIRFEDILQDLKGSVTRLYEWSDLDLAKINKMRFKAKKHLTANDTWQNGYTIGQHHWVTFEEANEFLEDDINKFQIERLASAEKQEILNQLGLILDRFSYSRELA